MQNIHGYNPYLSDYWANLVVHLRLTKDLYYELPNTMEHLSRLTSGDSILEALYDCTLQPNSKILVKMKTMIANYFKIGRRSKCILKLQAKHIQSSNIGSSFYITIERSSNGKMGQIDRMIKPDKFN